MLEIGHLFDQARQRTGLDDFGDDSYVAPLDRLVKSINDECELSALGVVGAPEMLITGLINLLEVEDCYKKNPEIDEVEVVAPVFGLGMPRTGSTAHGFIMSLDANTRVLRDWEANRLCPPPEAATQFTDPRIAACEAGNRALEAMVPELRNMLPRDVMGPTECYYMLTYTFATPALETFLHVPSYADWAASPSFDMEPAYRFHKRAIKLLQWRCPPNRWFLRSPPHLFGIEALLKVYPDARFVMTHRDPVRSVTSMCSFMQRFRSAFIANPDPIALGPQQMQRWTNALARTLAVRDRIGEDRFYDISHRRQIQDPAEQIYGLYEHLGWQFDEILANKIRHWQDENPKGEHRATPEAFGMTADMISDSFRFYTERFKNWL